MKISYELKAVRLKYLHKKSSKNVFNKIYKKLVRNLKPK